MAIPSGDIYLLRNVPLTVTYEHTIDFADKDEQFSYFYGFIKHTFSEFTYVRKEREYIVLELPLSSLDDINYLMFRSADGERLYYAFVVNKVYVSENSSQVFYMIDVMQTYMFDYKWNGSYIKQAHVDRWTAEHKPIYSKTDEGLDYGTEYSVESAYRLQQSDRCRWLLVSMKNHSALAEEGAIVGGGNIGEAPSPYGCYLVPLPEMVLDADSRRYMPALVNVNGTTVADYNDLIREMRNGSIGNFIVSITLLTYNPFIEFESGDELFLNFHTRSEMEFSFTKLQGMTTPLLAMVRLNTDKILSPGRTLARAEWDIGLSGSLPTSEQWNEIKKNPYTTKRDKRFESKLLCAPYRYNLLTDWRNNSVIIKNEYLPTDKIDVRYSYALSYNAPFRFWIKDYKKDPEGRNSALTQPIGLEFPILSDAYETYLLENKNTIQANLTNSIISSATSAISGAISGGGLGGLSGAIFGGVSGGISAGMNIQAHIRSENAKQADLRAKPDSVIASIDSGFNVSDNNTNVTFYRMRICCENEEIISEIFNMSGYKVNRVAIPNTRSRVRFNYIQTVGANITGAFNQADLAKIKEIYDRGITIWHYNKTNFKPLDYSFENIEVNLI